MEQISIELAHVRETETNELPLHKKKQDWNKNQRNIEQDFKMHRSSIMDGIITWNCPAVHYCSKCAEALPKRAIICSLCNQELCDACDLVQHREEPFHKRKVKEGILAIVPLLPNEFFIDGEKKTLGNYNF